MTQLNSMEAGFQIICPGPELRLILQFQAAREETEAWGGCLGELAKGRELVPCVKKAFGDRNGRQQKPQLMCPVCCHFPCPLLADNMTLLP
jgi:hypothetical protein